MIPLFEYDAEKDMSQEYCSSIGHLLEVVTELEEEGHIDEGAYLELAEHLKHIYEHKFHIKITRPDEYARVKRAVRSEASKQNDPKFKFCVCCNHHVSKRHWAEHKRTATHVQNEAGNPVDIKLGKNNPDKVLVKNFKNKKYVNDKKGHIIINLMLQVKLNDTRELREESARIHRDRVKNELTSYRLVKGLRNKYLILKAQHIMKAYCKKRGEEEEEGCVCGQNINRGLVKGEMRCEKCDIDGDEYAGGLTSEEEEEEDGLLSDIDIKKIENHIKCPQSPPAWKAFAASIPDDKFCCPFGGGKCFESKGNFKGGFIMNKKKVLAHMNKKHPGTRMSDIIK